MNDSTPRRKGSAVLWMSLALFGLFALMLQMKPDYIQMLWTDPLGVKMSIFALVMQILGAVCIKKIVDIKV